MNIVLPILGVLFFLIVALMFLRVTVIIEADESARVYLKILFVKIKLVPGERKKIKLSKYKSKKFKSQQEKEKLKELKKQQKKEQAAAKKKKKKEAAKQKELENPKPKQKKSVSDILDLVGLVGKLVGTFFSRFAKRLRLDLTRIHITLGGEDAASTAISYGIVCQSVQYLVAGLDNITNIKPKNKKDIQINANFLSDKTEIDIKLAASLRVWHVFDMLFAVAVKFVREKFFKNV